MAASRVAGVRFYHDGALKSWIHNDPSQVSYADYALPQVYMEMLPSFTGVRSDKILKCWIWHNSAPGTGTAGMWVSMGNEVAEPQPPTPHPVT